MKFNKYLINIFSQRFSFCSSEFNFRKLVELHNSVSKMQNIMASLEERVKSNKEGISCEFPLSFSSCFVFKISVFEFRADIDSNLQFFTSFRGFLRTDQLKDHRPINEFLSLGDDRITDLSNQYD